MVSNKIGKISQKSQISHKILILADYTRCIFVTMQTFWVITFCRSLNNSDEVAERSLLRKGDCSVPLGGVDSVDLDVPFGFFDDMWPCFVSDDKMFSFFIFVIVWIGSAILWNKNKLQAQLELYGIYKDKQSNKIGKYTITR